MKTNIIKLTTEYAKLVAQENAIKDEKKQMAVKIRETMDSIGASSYGTKYGMFTVYPITSWTFSKKVQAMEEEVEAMKLKEKTNGTAKAITSESLRFTSKK